MAYARVVPLGSGYAWGWEETTDPARVLWPVVRCAADLLTGPDLPLVRECRATGCGWLFVDETKNHSRRWCSMKGCGSRFKAREYYARRRAKGGAEPPAEG
jgi:predicted RNA-binding Zn ribbon-like protein